jgi:glucan phosphoethanolaminetransferase (alkaline phosphatase superfamily)
VIVMADPWAPPQTRLLDQPESDARQHARLLAWGGVIALLLFFLASFMFWLTGAFEDVFSYMGKRLPPATELVVYARTVWFALPALVLALTFAIWRKPAPAVAHRRVIKWGLALLVLLALAAAGAAWWALITGASFE